MIGSNHPECCHDPWQQKMGTTAAFIAMILWLPAVLLPMVTFSHFGRKTETGLLSGIEKLYHHGNTLIAGFLFLVSILFPLAKGISLALEGLYPRHTQQLGILSRLLCPLRWPFDVAAKYSLGELMVLALTLMALNGAYGIKTDLRSGFWVFLAMIVAMFLSTELLKWSSRLHKGERHETAD